MHSRKVAESTLLRARNFQLHSAMNGWAEGVELLKHQRLVVLRSLARIAKRSLSTAFDLWSSYTEMMVQRSVSREQLPSLSRHCSHAMTISQASDVLVFSWTSAGAPGTNCNSLAGHAHGHGV